MIFVFLHGIENKKNAALGVCPFADISSLWMSECFVFKHHTFFNRLMSITTAWLRFRNAETPYLCCGFSPEVWWLQVQLAAVFSGISEITAASRSASGSFSVPIMFAACS